MDTGQIHTQDPALSNVPNYISQGLYKGKSHKATHLIQSEANIYPDVLPAYFPPVYVWSSKQPILR